MGRRNIKEKIEVELGGVIVAKYRAHEDDLELILIVRSRERFVAVVTHGRQAHRAFSRPNGTPVSVKGSILEYQLPDGCGYRVVYVIDCQQMSFGDGLEQPPPDPPDVFTEQLSKFLIFQKCESLNGNLCH